MVNIMAALKTKEVLTEDGICLGILVRRIGTNKGSEVVVIYFLFVGHDKLSPAFLALTVLQPFFIQALNLLRICNKFGEFSSEMLVNLVVDASELQTCRRDGFDEVPVRLWQSVFVDTREL
jgi:hypothetical protein